MWIGEHESSKFWLSVLNELKNRGVGDILICYVDNLTGFSDAIRAISQFRQLDCWCASLSRQPIRQTHPFGEPVAGGTSEWSLSAGGVLCDKGYRGMKSKEGVRCEVFIPGTRGKRNRTIRKFLKRRNAIEPIIGHLKSDPGMDRNRLKGEDGDRIDILMAACGFNMKKLRRAFLHLLLRSLDCWVGVQTKYSRSLGGCGSGK